MPRSNVRRGKGAMSWKPVKHGTLPEAWGADGRGRVGQPAGPDRPENL